MDLEALIATAEYLQIDPIDLATVISYETGGTFDPMQPGPTTQWGQHRGLIQFGEPQARRHGVDFSSPEAALASQLGPEGAIVSYLLGSGFEPGMGILDLYSTINAGGPGLYDRTDENNGGAPGTVREKVEQQFGGHRENAARLLGGAPASAGLGDEPARPAVDWMQVDTPDGPIWVSRDYYRGDDGTYVRGSMETAQPILDRYGARLPSSVDEARAIYAASEMLPFLSSGGGPTGAEGGFAGQYPSAGNYDDLVALHNEALAARDIPTSGIVAGHFKDLLDGGYLYHPDQGLQGAHTSDPTYRDYSHGIRLVRDTAPDVRPAPVVADVAPALGPAPNVEASPRLRLGPSGDGRYVARAPAPEGAGLSVRPLPRGRGLTPESRHTAARQRPILRPDAGASGIAQSGLSDDRRGNGEDLLALGRMWFSGALG